MTLLKMTFVCLGNICRSPLAHKVMENKLNDRGLSARFTVDSSGLGGWHVGNNSDERMRRVAAAHGYHINHRAQKFHWQDGEVFDYIFAMDSSIYEGILDLISEKSRKKVMMFRKFDPKDPDGDVPDPYYGGANGFEEVFEIVEKNCEMILDYLLIPSQ